MIQGSVHKRRPQSGGLSSAEFCGQGRGSSSDADVCTIYGVFAWTRREGGSIFSDFV